MLPIENFLLSDVSRIQNCCTLHFRKKQISRSAPDVTQRLTIFLISRFKLTSQTNSKMFWKSDNSF